ncbi:MAG TPA: hypothetical protein VGL94_15515 [Ktedonobacteraceae bacterium]|jgi:hypothetical protein
MKYIKSLYLFVRADHLRSLIAICTLTYLLVSTLYVAIGYWPSGDEPHYLLISETLIKYHSLDVMKAYQHRDYLSFYPGLLTPHIVRVQGRVLPLHDVGGPILWLIPFFLFGRLGAVWFMAAISVLIVLNIYKLLLAMEIQQCIAFNVSLALALASPLCIYAHLNFIEPIAALVCVYVLRKFIERNVHISTLLMSSILLGLLPWTHVRFVLIEAPLFFMMLWRLYQQYRLHKIVYYVAYILPIALLTLGLEVFSWLFMGSFNPAINQVAGHNVIFEVWPFKALFGLLFDQDHGLLICFPLSALLLVGLVLSAKKRYLTYNLSMLLISVPYVIGFTTFHDWYGGWSPPARYVFVLLPVWSFYLAFALQQINGRFVKRFACIAFWWGVVYNFLSVLPSYHGFNDEIGRNNVLSFLHIGTFYLTDLWPSVRYPSFVCNTIWITAYLLLMFFLLLCARSNRKEKFAYR